MAIIYVSPLGGGDGSGSSVANAMTFTSLDAAIQKAGPGGTVMLLADKGAYNFAGSIAISHGGTATAPVTVMGVSSTGTPMDITINGTRDPNWSIGKADGNWVFKLYNGANNLIFDGIDFNNVGMAFQLAGDLQNVTLRNLEGDNVRYFIGNYAGGGASTASVSGLTIKDVEVHGFSKSVILLKYDTNNVVIDNVFGDSEYQDGDSFAMGVFFDGTVHDVLVKNTTMMNARGSNYSYWNGDGFTAERGVYNLTFENTLAKGNADGGYDLKSTNTVLLNAVAEDNTRNFRIWGSAELINPIGIDPRKQGGTGSQEQIWLASGATAKVSGGYFSDSGSSTSVIDSSGSISFSNTKFWHSGTLKIGSGNVSGLDLGLIQKISATGSYSTNGETYLPGGGYTAGYQTTTQSSPTSPTNPTPVTESPAEPVPESDPAPAADKSMTGTSGNDVLAPTTADNWTIDGKAGNDSITTLGGNDVLIGGAGTDTLRGGGGSDLFVYRATTESPTNAPDRILDFQKGVDKIDLSAIDAVIDRGKGNQAFKFIGESAFGNKAGQLRIDKSDPTKTLVQGDVNGDGVADFAIELAGNIALNSGDFIL